MSVLMRLGALALAAAALPLAAARAETPGVSLEFAVKASYLTKFGPFVQWPPSAMPADAPARICLVGADPFGRAIDQAVQGQQIQGHPLVVVRLDAVDAQTASTCQIMFVGKATTQPTAVSLSAAAGKPVLTVTDRSRGVTGGMIEFVLDHGRVRFDVDDQSAEACGLQISAKLLALAVEVRR